ncbi:MAG: LacI family transcriptional regulator [Pyrinomonadaceae bacterium]|nr:LacI family transcriptional regulator [Pyrinomonadaceae bacterium]
MRIKDVALEAGVSTATVSHVINQTKFVTNETRQKVLDAVEKLNFYPNAHARTLASGRSNIIGLLISDISNPFFPELVKSIESEAFEQGFNIMLFNTNYDPDRAAGYVRRLIELKVAGVALMTAELEPALIDELKRKEVRAVFNDLGIVSEHISNIVLDYSAGIHEAVRHLVSLGHKRIAHIAGSSQIRSGVIRREAFVEAIDKYLPGTKEKLIFEGDFRFESGRSAAHGILGLKELPTAIVVANDMMALGAMQELKAKGIKIPQDISIIGFDDIAFASLAEPALTTVCSPRVEIGRRAIEALIQTIKIPHQQGMEIKIPTYLIVRESTAPPKKK